MPSNKRAKTITPEQALGDNLRREKRRTGLSHTRLSELAGVHRTHIGLIMRGKRKVRVDTIIKLSGALEAPPGDLLKGVTWLPDGQGGGTFTD